jgi:ligand-binding sensor domain-containing protein
LLQDVKKICSFISFLIALLCYYTSVCAQPVQFSITSFTPVNGIASSDVTGLFQDSKNYLWITHAAGISRYDGNFENYLFSGETRLGRAFSIIEEKNRKWIGAEGGLFLFIDNAIRHISFTDRSIPVYSMATDKHGGLWICTSEGPAYLTSEDLRLIETSPAVNIIAKISPSWKKQFPKSNTSVRVSVDKAGSVYISDGMAVYQLTNHAVQLIWKSKERGDQVTSLVAKGKDSLYFSTVNTGFHCFENGKHAVIDNGFGNGNGLTDYNGQLYYYATTGIYLFDAGSHRLLPEVLLPEKFWEWGSCVLRDNENNFWIGTHEKLMQARRKIFSDPIQQTVEEFDEVYTIRQLKNGDLLCGTNRGKIFIRRRGGTSFSFRKKLFEQAPVSDILEDDEGNIWCGSFYEGIALIRNGKETVFTKKDGLRDNTNLFFLYTRSKELFTGGDNGVSKLIHGADGKVSFRNYVLTLGNHYPVFNTGIQKPDGGFLFGCNFGLFELRDDALKPVSIPNAPRKNFFVTDIKMDGGGLAWISTME